MVMELHWNYTGRTLHGDTCAPGAAIGSRAIESRAIGSQKLKSSSESPRLGSLITCGS